MAVRLGQLLAGLLGLLLLAACAVAPRAETQQRIALLAPFEGRYRELGYEAYYAAQLALAEAGVRGVDLLAVDDGGSPETALMRAEALKLDTRVQAVLVLGYAATDERALASLAPLPVVIVGFWGSEVQAGHIFHLSSPRMAELAADFARWPITELAAEQGSVSGGEVLALSQFMHLRDDLEGVRIFSSAQLPNDDFVMRILARSPFAAAPGLISTLVYDATGLTLSAMQGTADREQTALALREMIYAGINGEFRFDSAGFWQGAPLYEYAYARNQSLYLIP